MQLEPLETADTDPAMDPPVAAIQQSPESLTLGDAGNDAATTQQNPEFPENVGEDTGMHLPPELQRVIYQFARPVFRRCGRHLRIAETKFNNGGHQGFTCTKIGADERRSYPAIVNQPMAPYTGVYRWTWVVCRSWSGIVMPGVCTEAADPDQHSLWSRPHGATYGCSTGLICGFDNDLDHTDCKHREGDEIAFKLDTNRGLLEIYHSYYGCIHTMHVRGVTLYAYCGLEVAGDVVEYIKIDHDFANPYFCHARNEYYTRRNEPPRTLGADLRTVFTHVPRSCTVCVGRYAVD